MKRGSPAQTVGWREWVSLPQLGIDAVKAKVDTGARSSALHAFEVKTSDRGGEPWVTFKVHPIQDDSHQTVRCSMPLYDERWVRSSNGRRELRPVIRTTLQIGGVTWPVEVTLTSRDLMGFRMLLGRQAIRSRYLVDPGRSFLLRRNSPRATRRKKAAE